MKSLPGKWLIGLVVMGLLIAGLASPFVPCAQGEIRLKKYDQVKNSDSFKNYDAQAIWYSSAPSLTPGASSTPGSSGTAFGWPLADQINPRMVRGPPPPGLT